MCYNYNVDSLKFLNSLFPLHYYIKNNRILKVAINLWDILKLLQNDIELVLENIKIKPMTREQLIISVDRLTRFKYTEIKYVRVFRDILISNLIFPKLKKSQIENLSNNELKMLAEYIINYSVEKLGLGISSDCIINQRLYDYENSIFKLNDNINDLLQNKILYSSIIKLFNNDNNLPLNLRWLKLLLSENDIIQCRKNSSLMFPIERIIITEGITEEILLPVFAKVCGYDFAQNGTYIISAGGKNQVVKLFYQLVDTLKIPLFVLLDSDAVDNLNAIKPKLRNIDSIHLVKCGEFEDLLPVTLIKRTLDYDLKNFSKIELEFLKQDMPMVKILEEIFKEKGLHEFKKAEFAELVASQINSIEDVSSEIIEIINEIKSTHSFSV